MKHKIFGNWEYTWSLAHRHSCAHNVLERSAQHASFCSVTHVFGLSVMHVQASCVNKSQNKNKLRGNAPYCVVVLHDRFKSFGASVCLPCALCKQGAQYVRM
jgi:hypothetical protein